MTDRRQLLQLLHKHADDHGDVDLEAVAAEVPRSRDLTDLLRGLNADGALLHFDATGLGIERVVVYPSGNDARTRVLGVLRSHANASGVCAATFAELRGWLGNEAVSWSLHEMLLHLRDAGSISIPRGSLEGGIGDDRTFEVRLR